MKVAIVGGGICGLSLALNLKQRGIECRVYERAPEIKELGVGITLLPHAMREFSALGRMHEFETHFRGAIRNGISQSELAAILRQIAVYCGFPAAVDCHRTARKVLAAQTKKE